MRNSSMELTYTIKRSPKRKKLTITVERDRSVVVHAPTSASEESIHRIVESKRQWIYAKTNHDQKYEELPHAPGKELVSGESSLYLGRSYRVEVTRTKETDVVFQQLFLIPASHSSRRKEVLREWYVARADEILLPRVSRHGATLGVEFSSAQIVDNRYRWGSCTVKDTIRLNWRLIKAPMFVIDYVIIHELAHLLESNHTPRFWNIVKAQTPRMEKAKNWLKEHGQILEQDI